MYPSDANLIVSLLDIHPPQELADELPQGPLEIFEAGTGHGALTLHLARAIHGQNDRSPPLPPLPPKPLPSAQQPDGDGTATTVNAEPSFEELNNGLEHKAAQEAYDNYLPTRRAIIHTLDISAQHSKHAQTVVRNFRCGLYYHNIDFHVGTIPDYLTSRLASTSEPFLEHTILDLPDPHQHFEIIAKCLKPSGSLLVFSPSITQINTCVKRVKDERLPFLLEKVLELGAGVDVGGREWDVRLVKPRALLKAEAAARQAMVDGKNLSASETAEDEQGEQNEESTQSKQSVKDENTSQDSGWEMICRPKVGGRVTGGGFVGLWRRMDHTAWDALNGASKLQDSENQTQSDQESLEK